MWRTIGMFCILVSAAILFACGVSSPTSTSVDDTTADEPLGITSDGAAPVPPGCIVTLNFCDRPSSSIGTDCKQSVQCGLSTAETIPICKQIVANVGCTVHCDAVMRDSNNNIIDVWRESCGSRCCPENTFCFNGRCCPFSGGINCPS